MTNHTTSAIDITVLDKEERPVMVVEAKTRRINEQDREHLSQFLGSLNEAIPFAMLADPTAIQLFQWDGRGLSGPVASFPTKEILQNYDPEFDRIRIFDFYLVSLLERWLRDVAYHWKSDSPPASAELRGLGLLQLIDGGTTSQQVEVFHGHLHCVR